MKMKQEDLKSTIEILANNPVFYWKENAPRQTTQQNISHRS